MKKSKGFDLRLGAAIKKQLEAPHGGFKLERKNNTAGQFAAACGGK